MPRASDKIAAAEVTLFLRSRRQANTKSARSESSHKMTLILPPASRQCGTEPNARASPRSRLLSLASAMCDASSSISRLRRSPRNAFTMRETNDISDCSQNPDFTTEVTTRRRDRAPVKLASLLQSIQRRSLRSAPGHPDRCFAWQPPCVWITAYSEVGQTGLALT